MIIPELYHLNNCLCASDCMANNQESLHFLRICANRLSWHLKKVKQQKLSRKNVERQDVNGNKSSTVTSVADPGCLSRIRLFSIPDPGSELSPSRIPNPHQRIKYFNPKKCKKKWFLSSKKYDPGCSSRIRMLTFSHPGSRGQKGTQSRIPDPQHWP